MTEHPMLRAIGRMTMCLATGFASGMPMYLILQLFPVMLEDAGLSLETIGASALIMLPYTWKFLWAPLTDRYAWSRLGRRRTWMLATQLVLTGLMASLAWLNPEHPDSFAMGVFGIGIAIAFASASQDIVLDAYRREILSDEELGLGNSIYVNAYRLSSLIPGSLALFMADLLPWSVVHLTVAGVMFLCIIPTLLTPEPDVTENRPATLTEAVKEPLAAFVRTWGRNGTVLILAFMLLYKLGDTMALGMSSVFYLRTGFSKTDVASVVKVASLWSSVVGGTLGGVLMLRLGIRASLYVFGVVQLLSILGFAWLATVGADKTALFYVVSFEYFGVGLGTAAFVSYIASMTDPRYTATQFALLTSLSGLPRTFATAGSGYLAQQLGWTAFFLLCTMLAIPGLALLPWVPRAPATRSS